MIFRRTAGKEDNLLNIVRNLRQDIRDKVKEETLSEYDEARKQGKYPWEGMWLKPELISLVQEKLRKKNKVVLLELSIFFFILAFFILPIFSNIIFVLLPNQHAPKIKNNTGQVLQNVKPSVKTEAASSVLPDYKIKDSTSSAMLDSGKTTLRKGISERFMANQRAEVSKRGVRLRKGPGTRYKPVSMLRYGEVLTVKDAAGGGQWVKISTSRSSDGWVLGDYIKIIK